MDEIPPILLVEDELLVRLTIAEALEHGGYTVIQCDSGPAAIDLIDSLPDIRGLVTDIRLGSHVDGWQVAHHARVKFPCVAVVYITGDSANEWTASGVPESAMLQKPFASSEIVTALANLLITQQNITRGS